MLHLACDCEPGPEGRHLYMVTAHEDPTPLLCAYCTSCAELAMIGWTGDIAACAPCPVVFAPTSSDAWKLMHAVSKAGVTAGFPATYVTPGRGYSVRTTPSPFATTTTP